MKLRPFPACALAWRDRFSPVVQDVLLLALRLVFGWQFFLTGRGKLTHLERTTEFFASLHLPAPGAHAVGIGLLELTGGILLILGAGTRVFATLLASTMIVALATAHRSEITADGLDGLFAAPPFPYLIVTFVLVAFGPGRVALDHLLFRCPQRSCDGTAAAR